MFFTFSNFFGSSNKFPIQRCIAVLPSMSWALGSAPNLIKAYTFFIKRFIVAKWRAVAPFLSIVTTSMFNSLLNIKIAAIPSYLYAAQLCTDWPLKVN